MNELMEKIITEFKANGIELSSNINNSYDNYNVDTMRDSVGCKWICIKEVYRHNGTEKNVNAEISVYVTTGNRCSERIDKVRVNENASDRVIKNRAKKIMEIYK